MAGNANQKLKLLYLLQILREETDEENPIKTADILRRLSDMGINAERKSIYRDIACLQDAGFDIISSSGGGYFMGSRDFEMSEIKLLIDAVQASRFITYQKSVTLINKLKNLVSVNQSAGLDRQLHMAGRKKASNEQIYYVIDTVYDAIAEDKQISFRYLDYTLAGEKHYRSGGNTYTVSPYALVWDDEYYYLFAYYENRDIMANFRVDKIDGAKITDKRRLKSEEYKNFDPIKQSETLFSMFGGEEEWVTLIIDNSLMGVFVDRFGSDLAIVKVGDEKTTVRFKAAISPTFLSWLFQFGTRVKILTPEKLIKKMQEMLADVINLYGETS